LYDEKGLKGILKLQYGTNQSELNKHQQDLISYFEKYPPPSVNAAVHVREQRTGIRRSPNRVRIWMKHHGLKYLKTGQIPSKADVKAQKEFVNRHILLI
jgi:transposase